MDKQAAIKKLLEHGILPTSDKISELSGTLLKSKTKPEVILSKRKKVTDSKIEIINNYSYKQRKLTVQDFSENLRGRYSFTKNLLLNRKEAQEAISISRAQQSKEKNVTIIAMIQDISQLPTGTYRLKLEDLSGQISAIISAKNEELIQQAAHISNDEVLAFTGAIVRNTLFISELVWPDVPIQEIKKCPEEVYAVFTSDIHIGSNMFLPHNFENFIKWLSGESGSDKQKDIANKTKYVFITGDLVDGVGVYPQQEDELVIRDIYRQYEVAYKYFRRIPEDKQIIISPGNHDGVRLAEPQPPIYDELMGAILDLPNVINLSNPASMKIQVLDNFPGTHIQLYHGMSYDYYAQNVVGIREAGAYHNPDIIMKFLLKRRHLAPTVKSTLVLPLKEDALLLREVPNVFVSGHIHRPSVSKYKNITLIANSCWQAKTAYQEKVGHTPIPCKIPVLNLKTMHSTILDFS